MFYDNQDSELGRSLSELVSVRRLDTLRRHGTLNRTTTLPPLGLSHPGSFRRPVKRVNTLPQHLEEDAGLDNPAMDLYEQALRAELDQTIVIHPDVFHSEGEVQQRQEDSDRVQQIDGLRRVLGKAVSLAPRNSVKGKAPALPSPTDFNQNWEGIESYLHKQIQDTDPETLITYRKPFYLRTWFALTIYVALALSMIALIIGIACFIAVVVPNKVIKGEIVPTTTTSPSPAPLQDFLAQDSTTPDSTTVDTTPSITMDSLTPVQEELDQTTTTEVASSTTTESPIPDSTSMSTDASVQPTTTEGLVETTTSDLFFAPVNAEGAVPTTMAPLPTTVASDRVLSGNWEYLLSLPGPLQGFGTNRI